MTSQRPVLLPWIRQVGIRKNHSAAVNAVSRITVIEEATFVQMLRFEVRRTERSGKYLMLILINSEHFGGKAGATIVESVVAALGGRIRETDIVGWYEQDATIGVLMTELESVNSTIVGTITQKISNALESNAIAERSHRLSLSYHLFPQTDDTGSGKLSKNTFYADLTRRHDPKKEADAAKRAMDILGSLTALLVFLPFILIIALLVKLTSKGPILFCQERVGKQGKLFRFYKFRSMYVNNDSQIHREYVTRLIAGGKDMQAAGGIYKLTNDPRITRLGSFLRKSSLDELPQLFNVLRSDMSLVGPRPPLPYEYDRYQLWHRRRVLELKPGLTGLWQVEGRSRTTFDEMVRMDLRYANTKSLWTDCTILLKTPGAILSGRGAC